MREWWRWALFSPDGVAPSRMVSVSASVNLPLHHKVQKFSSGTGSPGWSGKKGRKMVVVVWWWWSWLLLSLFAVTRHETSTIELQHHQLSEAPGHNVPLTHLMILTLHISFACLLGFPRLIPFFFTFPLRIGPLRFQAGRRNRQPDPA